MTPSAFESRLIERARHAGLNLPRDFAAPAERFYDLLRKWNASTNLTALPLDGYPDGSIDRLLIEPLQAAELVAGDSARFCVDVGSGGGSPAIPFAIARPSVRMLMVEAVGKKAAFLREAVRLVGLPSVEVRHARFENIAPELEQTIDLLLIRGVKLTKDLSRAMQLGLKKDGKLFAFGGSRDTAEFAWRLTDERSLSVGNALLVFEVAN